VRWESTPPTFSSTVSTGLVLASVTLNLASLGVVGSSGPGDPRTTTPGVVKLQWDSANAPSDVSFSMAPTGSYSLVTVQLDGMLTSSSFSFRGTYNGISYSISDRNPLTISIDINRTLQPGGLDAIGLMAKFDVALAAIDWATAPIDDQGAPDQSYEISGSSAQMPAFRNALMSALQIDSTIQ